MGGLLSIAGQLAGGGEEEEVEGDEEGYYIETAQLGPVLSIGRPTAYDDMGRGPLGA